MLLCNFILKNPRKLRLKFTSLRKAVVIPRYEMLHRYTNQNICLTFMHWSFRWIKVFEKNAEIIISGEIYSKLIFTYWSVFKWQFKLNAEFVGKWQWWQWTHFVMDEKYSCYDIGAYFDGIIWKLAFTLSSIPSWRIVIALPCMSQSKLLCSLFKALYIHSHSGR